MKVRLIVERDTNECYAKIAGKNYKFTRDKYGVLCAEVGDTTALEFVALPINSAFAVYQDPDDIAAAKIARAAKPARRVMAREEPAPVQPVSDPKRMAPEEPLSEKKYVDPKRMAPEEPFVDKRFVDKRFVDPKITDREKTFAEKGIAVPKILDREKTLAEKNAEAVGAKAAVTVGDISYPADETQKRDDQVI